MDIRDQVRQDYTQILLDPKNSILTGDTGSAALSDAVSRWRQWSYYKLKYQEFQP